MKFVLKLDTIYVTSDRPTLVPVVLNTVLVFNINCNTFRPLTMPVNALFAL